MHNIINDGEFVKDYETFHPFGPRIFKSKLNAEDLTFLQNFAEIARNAPSAGSSLSGNIKDQKSSHTGNKEKEQHVLNILCPYIIEWYKIEDQQRLWFLDKNDPESENLKNVDYNSINFHTGTGTWFNYMKANEFNPLHAHSGSISGIVMVKVPEEISQEPDNIKIESNARCPGMLEWVHGEFGAGAYRTYPVEGDIYLFDAKLRHQVYPFQSDVERITMSWNVFETTFDKKIEVNFE
jgi:hypothetical protein|tara:strand:+ start:6786 stop:7499 length:714 start_codon:yes stop_codon:yes gene_type:complete